MLYNQPLATRFGTDISAHLAAGTWTTLDIAVAWVRASGVAHLRPALEAFLSSGGALRVTVGLDLQGTTLEGLQGLLDLRRAGRASTHVFHNEAGGIFHPKLYLFRNSHQAKLIVGSNNLTESGLYQNTEAGLEVDLPIHHATIVAAIQALDAWRDPTMDLAKPLDAALLAELHAEGYVIDEATARAAVRTRATRAGGPRRRLFGRVPITPPARPTTFPAPTSRTPVARSRAAATPASPIGQVLLMRVRKAHAVDRPTQTQLPKAVAQTPFFNGITEVKSTHDGVAHRVIEATARNIINTLKLEIPEMRTFADPVVRLERTATDVVYEVYDVGTPRGNTIMNALTAGLSSSPPQTSLTRPNDPPHSTWWRFI